MPDAQYRTLNDVYSLIEPQMPLEAPYHPGQTVQIRTNVQRLLDHEWIENAVERDDRVTVIADLTQDGSKLLNYYARADEEGWLGSQLQKGAGAFVNDALSDSDSINVVEIDGDRITVEMPDGTEREYQRITS